MPAESLAGKEPAELGVHLDDVKIGTLVEYLAARCGLVTGELRFVVKSGRYERGRAVVPLDRLR